MEVLKYDESHNEIWKKLISQQRDGPVRFEQEGRNTYQRDFDRILFSNYFRRMQQKTQVFPLNLNTLVHNRMTHSFETSTVGRSLGQLVKQVLKNSIDPQNSELIGLIDQIDSIVCASCLAHDLGNPPFGHLGEDSIQSFWENILKKEQKKKHKQEKEKGKGKEKEKEKEKDKKKEKKKKNQTKKKREIEKKKKEKGKILFPKLSQEQENEKIPKEFEGLEELVIKDCAKKQNFVSQGDEKADYLYFDGNANTFRIIASQYGKRRGLYLSYSTIASTVKYPWGTKECEQKHSKSSVQKSEIKKKKAEKLSPYRSFRQRKIRHKKSGYFERDREIFEKIFTKLNLKGEDGFYRHPLSFLVEAADDICYHVMDMEDAFKIEIIQDTQATEQYENLHQESQKIISSFERLNQKFSTKETGKSNKNSGTGMGTTNSQNDNENNRDKNENEKENKNGNSIKNIQKIKLTQQITSTKQSPKNKHEEDSRWRKNNMDIDHHISKKRAILINDLIWVAYYQFCYKYTEIMEHKFFDNLLDSAFEEYKIRTKKKKSSWELFQEFSRENIYRGDSLLKIGVNGKIILSEILRFFYTAWSECKPIKKEIQEILPIQFFPMIKQNKNIFSQNNDLPLTYILDFISQMDDFYAFELYQKIVGEKLQNSPTKILFD
ncbi:deoxyguanosinetriphosphate triphosphohydrolase [Anaeramoeba flamelloides]|uniref:Deoxyguanosinetriphosphate triphosphohydrolase n=1 Tax=Anaeramoeba flamelloides TaxID=1746091 RepID=A0ABQ8XCH6_9EUKA|nr:deoxyguanosinetriphosphate triphosphohydrolase [Anaeramoeba flamelloides]